MTTTNLQNTMQNPENLAKAYTMAKEMLRTTYGEQFERLSEVEQAKAVAHVLADLLKL